MSSISVLTKGTPRQIAPSSTWSMIKEHWKQVAAVVACIGMAFIAAQAFTSPLKPNSSHNLALSLTQHEVSTFSSHCGEILTTPTEQWILLQPFCSPIRPLKQGTILQNIINYYSGNEGYFLITRENALSIQEALEAEYYYSKSDFVDSKGYEIIFKNRADGINPSELWMYCEEVDKGQRSPFNLYLGVEPKNLQELDFMIKRRFPGASTKEILSISKNHPAVLSWVPQLLELKIDSDVYSEHFFKDVNSLREFLKRIVDSPSYSNIPFLLPHIPELVKLKEPTKNHKKETFFQPPTTLIHFSEYLRVSQNFSLLIPTLQKILDLELKDNWGNLVFSSQKVKMIIDIGNHNNLQHFASHASFVPQLTKLRKANGQPLYRSGSELLEFLHLFQEEDYSSLLPKISHLLTLQLANGSPLINDLNEIQLFVNAQHLFATHTSFIYPLTKLRKADGQPLFRSGSELFEFLHLFQEEDYSSLLPKISHLLTLQLANGSPLINNLNEIQLFVNAQHPEEIPQTYDPADLDIIKEKALRNHLPIPSYLYSKSFVNRHLTIDEIFSQVYLQQNENEWADKTTKPFVIYLEHHERKGCGFSFFDQVRSTHRVAFFNFKTISEVCAILDKVSTTQENLDLVVYEAHGASNMIGYLNPRITFNTDFPASGCLKNLRSNTTVLLISCSTGKGNPNIAQYIAANTGGARVIAPTQPIAVEGTTVHTDTNPLTIETIGYYTRKRCDRIFPHKPWVKLNFLQRLYHEIFYRILYKETV